MKQNYINHIALVLDASSSMIELSDQLIKVADNQIAYLAQRSMELDQETRISVYVFANDVKCVVWDKDVLRLPSIREFYSPYGYTALIKATIKCHEDLSLTPQMYGDHAFLTYVLTDGEENCSNITPMVLSNMLKKLPENCTIAVLVPNQNGVFWAKKAGFPTDNIAVWDATTTKGVSEVGEVIRKTTDNFMVGRASGIRGTRSLFSNSADSLNKQTVKDAHLKPISKGGYVVFNVVSDATIRDFVEAQGLTFQKGSVYYQLTKVENIQSYKGIVVRNKKSGRFYTGPQVRDLLGLADNDVRVKHDVNPEYEVYVQSTSVNRRLMAKTKVMVLK